MKFIYRIILTGLLATLPVMGNAKEIPATNIALAASKPTNIKGFAGKWTGVVFMQTAAGGFERYDDFKLKVKSSGAKSATISGTALWQKSALDTKTYTVKITGTLKQPKIETINEPGHKGYIKKATASIRFSNGTTGTGYFQVSEISGFKSSGTNVSFKRGPWRAKPGTDARFSRLP